MFFWCAALSPRRKNIRASRRKNSRTSKAIPPDPPVHMPWLDLLPFRQTWAFAIGKFLTDRDLVVLPVLVRQDS